MGVVGHRLDLRREHLDRPARPTGHRHRLVSNYRKPSIAGAETTGRFQSAPRQHSLSKSLGVARYEHRVLNVARRDLEAELNALGSDRWFALAVVRVRWRSLVILRRPLESPEKEPRRPAKVAKESVARAYPDLGVRITLRDQTKADVVVERADHVVVLDDEIQVFEGSDSLTYVPLADVSGIHWHAGAPRHNEAWSDEEKEFVESRRRGRTPTWKIAHLLGRTEGAIIRQAESNR